MHGFSFDIESDGLYLQSSKIWYMRLTSFEDGRSLSIKPFEIGKEKAKAEFISWLNSFDDGCIISFHHGLGFDLWALWKLLGIVPRVGKEGKDWLNGKHVQYIDTYVLSMYLNPDLPKHSLEYLASGSEDEKMDYRGALVEAGVMKGNEEKGFEFSFWDPLMADYCDDDVAAQIGVLKKLWKQAQERYKDKWIHPSFRQIQKDYWLYSAQAFSGVRFNKEKAQALLEKIDEEMAKLKQEVEPLLPSRPLKTAEKSFYKIPAKPFTKSGEFSANMLKWLEKHSAKVIDGNIHAYGLVTPLVANEILPVQLPMEIEDGVELKDWFIEQGWKPSDDHWNFKKDPLTGKPERDERGKMTKTTPKIQHQGQICPNLLKLEGEIPKKVVKFLSYRNRKGVVEGWLSNWRIEFDGRLSAEISGYAPTSRVKHKTVCNVPKADIKVLLGAEMRDLFYVDEGNWYCGIDAAALENRTLSHHTFKYDNGKFADLNLNGDVHCFSEDTEILTKDGWKVFSEVTKESFVAQWEEDGTISFVHPSDVIWEDYNGEMVSFNSRTVNMLVTPNHRVPMINIGKKSKSLVVEKAVDVSEKNSNRRFPCSGYTNEHGISLSDDEIRMVVATQADGYLAKDCSQISFCFVKQRKVERMREILDRLSIKYSYTTYFRKGRDEHKFYINSGEFTTKIRDWLNPNKSFSHLFLGMSSRQCTVFIEEIPLWDGTITKDGNILLDTTCKESRDIVEAIAVISGMAASSNSYHKTGTYRDGGVTIHRVYISSKLKKSVVAVQGVKKDIVNYSGKVGCVTVPSSFIVVRRGGRVVISGNSHNCFAFFPHLAKEFDPENPENKENPKFKPWRAKAKTGAYLLAFGGGAAKLSSSLGLSKKDGQEAYDNYWKFNEGLGKLKDAVEKYYKTTGQNKWIPAIDGRIVSVRGANVLISCLGQGSGAIAISYACCLMDTWLGELHIDDLGRPFYLYKGKKVKRVSAIHRNVVA